MYKELEGIDYVVYETNADNKIHILNIIDNKNDTVENTGEPWYQAAYGNCLISLENSKVTDKLYLIKKSLAEKIIWVVNKGFTDESICLLEAEAVIITR